MNELRICLKDALEMLNVGGRIAVISFHSLEDRIVKETFQSASSTPKIDKRIPLRADQIESAPYRCVNKKPILASQEELDENNRSHSAKLRVIERVK